MEKVFLVKVGRNKYITYGDNLWESEQRWLEEGIYPDDFEDYTIKEIKLTKSILKDKSIQYF